MTEQGTQQQELVNQAPVLKRRRALPGGRAVVGAFLVVASALGVFAAYLASTAPPVDSWLVAARPIAVGHVFQADDLTTVLADVPAAQQQTLLRAGSLADLVGAVATGPIDAGSFIPAALTAPVGQQEGELVSFSLPVDRALGGDVGRGAVVDIVATYGSGAGATTAYVVRGVTVTARQSLTGGVGAGGVLVTVRLPDPVTVQRVLHAVGNATVHLVSPGSGGETPAAFSVGGAS